MNARTFDFIAVVGIHCSGSNRVAGILNRLGLHFGDRFTGEYRYDALGGLGFEEADLVNICNRVAPFPSTNYRQTHSRICVELERWINQKRFEADRKVTLAAAKHPLLCRLGDHLISVCGDRLRVISVDRPVDESIDSLVRQRPEENPDMIARHQHWLHEGKCNLLARLPEEQQLMVHHPALLDKPEEQMRRIAAFITSRPANPQLVQVTSGRDPANCGTTTAARN